jgi:uncharacterized protein YukE
MKEPDLIDKIANCLPVEIRAEYYRTMRHLRSLPENDEMLQILYSMMFLTHMTEQVPARILTEREKFESSCNEFVVTAKRLETTGSKYYQELNTRLKQLPVDLVTGLNPKAIVERINDNLKRQFEISTIPIVAEGLSDSADTIKKAAKDYSRATAELNDQWRSASQKAYESIGNIQTAITKATEAAEKATKSFSRTFNKTYQWAFGIFIAIALLTGTMGGILIFDHLRPRTKTVYEIPDDLLILLESRKRDREQSEREKQEAIPVPQKPAAILIPKKQESKPKQETKPDSTPILLDLDALDLNITKYMRR